MRWEGRKPNLKLITTGGVSVALNLDQKKAVVAEVAEVAAVAHSAIAAEYVGLTVEAMTDLRVKARENNVYLRVVKNTLARRAFEGTDYECMSDAMVGPLVLAFSQEDPGAAARPIEESAGRVQRGPHAGSPAGEGLRQAAADAQGRRLRELGLHRYEPILGQRGQLLRRRLRPGARSLR